MISENTDAKQKHMETEPVQIEIQKQPEKIKRSNRPFSPTKVPSPVYGYKRPEKIVQHESVEYELSTFEKENSLKPVQVDNNLAVEKEITKFVHHPTESTASVRSIDDSDHITAATKAVNEEQEFYLNQESLSESNVTVNEFVKEEHAAAERNYEMEEATGLETAEVVPVAFVENDMK